MAPVDPLVLYGVVAIIVVASIAAISMFFKDSKKENRREAQGQRPPQAPRQENVPPGARRRAGGRQRRRMVNRDDSDDEAMGGGPPDEDDLFDQMVQPEGKIGAKKLRKLQDKADRKAARLAEEEEREEKKKREHLLEKQRKKEEEERKAEEAEREKEEQLIKEEKAQKEHEEYLLMKEAFSVEEEGEADADIDLNSQSLLQEFINYIKESKVVMLEDLAAHFKLKTQEVINRVQELVSDGTLTGVIDDRGKFIYITMDELQAVAKHIKQHGRVSIIDLAISSNRLINLNPEKVHRTTVDEVSG